MVEKKPIYSLTQEDREQLIVSHPVFSLLAPHDIQKLSFLMQEIHIQSGSIIVAEGTPVDSVYLIAEGLAEVTHHPVTDKNVPAVLLATLNKGEAIGLTDKGLFSETGLRTATVIAAENVTLLGIDIETLRQFMPHHDQGNDHDLLQASDRLLKINFIKEADPFLDLTAEELFEIVNKMPEISVLANEYIFREGEEGERCYLIREGIVDISVGKNNHSQKIIASLSPFALFGTGALLRLCQRPANAHAKTHCKLVVLSRQLIVDSLQRDHVLAAKKEKSSLEKMCPHPMPQLIITEKNTVEAERIVTLKNAEFNTYYQLNREGEFIWNLINGQHSIQDILKCYATHSKKQNDAAVLDLFDDLRHRHLIFLTYQKADAKRSWVQAILGCFSIQRH